MTTAEIIANLLDNWAADLWLPGFEPQELVDAVMAEPVLLLEMADRIATCPADRAFAEELAFTIVDRGPPTAEP